MPVVWNPEANAIFLQLLEQTPDQREALLQQCCGEDIALAGHVRSLLAASERAGSFLESPPTIVANLADTASERVAEAPTLDFLSPPERPDALGRLGHYDILAVVGSGGFGVVLKAFDSQLHRVVAIKALNPSLAASATARRRFVREARTAAAINHENVVNTYAVEESGVVPYLVMEFVGGIALDDKLTTDGPLEVKEILRIGMQIAAGLAAAHKQGLVHRDVKPANILLENGVERVKITDFGLARTVDDVTLTQTGVIAGTPQYMSPEQARGEAVDHRSDLFSLGSVLYAMCAGRAPYRGETSLAVLKKVCDDTPHPLRDLNADIPDWLEEIIAKLHAHDKAERYQSAAEVADLLNQHLAELQQPTLASRRGPPPAKEKPRSNSPIRAWLIGAAALVLLAVTLTITEAGGVTSLATTVVRIFTPMGTLIVETNDPGVKVTIQGDGGLKLTGAGLQEIRLPLGSYRVVADKDGQRLPLERELVSIAKGGREVVKVKLEATPASMDTSDAEVEAFVLLGGGSERKFSTLADAVIGSSDGDTIEIRGNGPFVTHPIRLAQSLTVRAAAGYHPVIRLSTEGAKLRSALLKTTEDLVLEGIEFQRLAPPIPKQSNDYEVAPCLIWGKGGSLRVANCRFLVSPHMLQVCVYCESATRNLEVVNSIFLCPDSCAISAGRKIKQRTVKNCVVLGSFANGVHRWKGEDGAGETIQLANNTFVLHDFATRFYTNIAKAEDLTAIAENPIALEAANNIFDATAALFVGGVPTPVNALNAEKFFDWRDNNNLYRQGGSILSGAFPEESDRQPPKTLADWNSYWQNAKAVNSEGAIRYEGGDLFSKLDLTPERVSPDDFRLRRNSAGYRAGKDGQDLGANVDLVGPGEAYERWKKTPEYQQWLTESVHLGTEAAPAEAQAFVVLGGAGVAEREFNTLIDAVVGCSDGDTIEIRGNGPFLTPPIVIQQALTIRAGEGFQPVIRISPGAPGDDWLIATHSPLVLEGLDIREVSKARSQPVVNGRSVIYSDGKSLSMANCRVLQEKPIHEQANLVLAYSNIILRNCEFHSPPGPAIVSFSNQVPVRLKMDNCVGLGGDGSVAYLHYAHAGNEASVELRHNTFVIRLIANMGSSVAPDPPPPVAEKKQVRFEASANIFAIDAGMLLFETLDPLRAKGEVQKAEHVEEFLRPLFGWRETRNLYAPGATSIYWSPKQGEYLLLAAGNLQDWQRRWDLTDTGSFEGNLRFHGGNLLAKAAVSPEKITAEDFRLRPDSAGYQAGDDGKDLGADVDLVGPGPAYDRWKKTPQYQQWLKETGQKQESGGREHKSVEAQSPD